MKSICVFCGSSDAVHAEYKTAARGLGALLAHRQIRLVYGGGKSGLMGEVANGALAAGGEVIGVIIPPLISHAHSALTRMEVAADMHARKARMHELADAFIVLPGGYGTWDELFETVTWSQIGTHQKPVGLLNTRDYYQPLLAAIDHAVSEGFILKEHREGLCCETDAAELMSALASYEHPHAAVKKWIEGNG